MEPLLGDVDDQAALRWHVVAALLTQRRHLPAGPAELAILGNQNTASSPIPMRPPPRVAQGRPAIDAKEEREGALHPIPLELLSAAQPRMACDLDLQKKKRDWGKKGAAPIDS